MAVEIGALRAMLSLDSAAFERGAKRAEASMNNIQRRMSRVGRSLRGFGTTMSTRVTAPVVAGFGLMARSAFNSAFEIERMADLSNSGLIEFQRFAAGARDVGIEQDKLSDILKDTNDRIGDFVSTGGGPMADFFENIAPKVGVTAEQFEKLSGPEALQLYVSSLEKAGLSQQQMTFYMEALASDATALLPLLRNNGKEMDRLGDAAEDAGAIMDQKTVKALNSSREALRAAGDAAKGLFNQFAASLAPVLETVAVKLQDATQWFSDLSPEMRRMVGIGTAVAAAIGPVAVGLGFVATGLAALASPIGLVVFGLGAVAGVAAAVAANWDTLKERFPILERAANLATDIKDAWEDLPAIKWHVLIPTLTVAIFKRHALMSGALLAVSVLFKPLTWTAALIPKLAVRAFQKLALGAGAKFALSALVKPLVWTARLIPGIGWFALAGSLAWDLLIDKIKWKDDGWIPEIKWADWLTKINWSDWIPTINWRDWVPEINWSNIFGGDTAGSAARRAGRDTAQGLAEGMLGNQGAVESAADAVAGAAEASSRSRLQTRSPSRVFMRIGRDLMDGLGIGVQDRTQAAVDALESGAGKMSGALDSIGTGADRAAQRFGNMAASVITGARSIGDVVSQLGNQLLSSSISGIASSIFGGGGGSGNGLLGMGNFLGFLDKGGIVPSGSFAIAGERGPEIVTGPARVTSRADTARMLQPAMAQPARVEVVARVENGSIVQDVREISGEVAVSVMQQGIQAYDRQQLPGRVQQISNDPRRRG